MTEMWAINYPNRPTFYLCPHVCGIVSEGHARRVGATVLGVGDIESVAAALVDIDDGPFDIEDLTGALPAIVAGDTVTFRPGQTGVVTYVSPDGWAFVKGHGARNYHCRLDACLPVETA